MAAKKKRGLSGTPEEHAHEAESYAVIAKEDYESSRKHIEKNNCRMAFVKIEDGIDAYATADREMKWSGASRLDSLERAASLRAKTTEEFFQKCVVKTGGISGMKRRSRR